MRMLLAIDLEDDGNGLPEEQTIVGAIGNPAVIDAMEESLQCRVSLWAPVVTLADLKETLEQCQRWITTHLKSGQVSAALVNVNRLLEIMPSVESDPISLDDNCSGEPHCTCNDCIADHERNLMDEIP